MRLLVISREYEPMVAGVSKYISEILPRLKSEKTVIVLSYKRRKNDKIVEIAFPGFVKKRIIKAAYFVLASVLKSFRTRYDVVVGNALIGCISGFIIKTVSGKPLVSIVYDVDFLERDVEYGRFNKLVRKYVLAAILALSDRIIVDSEKVKRDITRFYGIGGRRIVAIPCGTNRIGKFRRIRKVGKRIILFVGNMAEKKGLTDLVNAMKPVADSVRGAELWLVGPSEDVFAPYQKRLRKLVSSIGLSGRVRFFGMVDSVEPYYDACEFLVLPSHHSEGFGLPIIEAAQFGKPSVATRIFRQTGVINKRTGLVVPEKNPQELANAMLMLLENKKLRARLGSNAKMFSRKFDWGISAEKFENVVQEAYGRAFFKSKV